MKVFAFLVALAIFVGSLFAFGYSFAVEGAWQFVLFGGGILGVALALGIPFHLLEKFD